MSPGGVLPDGQGAIRSARARPAAKAGDDAVFDQPHAGIRPIRGVVVERPRLIPAPWRRLFLATAPAGYGKTILLRQLWAAISDKQAVKIWLPLSPAHRDFEVFLQGLSAALKAQSFSPQEWRGRPEEMGSRLAAAIIDASQPFYLILDDYHAAAGPELDAFIRAMVSASGDGPHLAIATRSRAGIGAAILAARGDLTSVGAADLAFSAAEALHFLQGKSPEEDALALHAQTEGWPAALQLASRSPRAGQAGRGARRAVSATSGEVGVLIAEETFDPLPEPLRTLLIETAHLNTLSAGDVDEVRGRGDSAGLLQELEGSVALVSPERDRPDRLRRHPLLRRFLEARFTLLAEDRRNELVERTISCLVRGAEIGAALRLAQRSSPGSSSLALLESAPSASVWTAEALLDLPGDLANLSEDRFAGAPRAARLRGLSLYAGGRMADARAATQAGLAQIPAGETYGIGARGTDIMRDRKVWEALYAAIFDEAVSDQVLSDVALIAAETAGRASHTLPAHVASVLALRAGRSGEADALAGLIGADADEHLPARELGSLHAIATALFDASPQRAAAALALLQMQTKRHPNLEAAFRLCSVWLAEERGASWSEADLPARDGPPLLLGLSPELFVERARLAAAGSQRSKGVEAASAVLHVARAAALASGWRRAEAALDAEMLNLWSRAGRRDASARALAEIVTRRAKSGRSEAVLALARFDVSTGACRRARARLSGLLAAPDLCRRRRVEALIVDARAAFALKQAEEADIALEQFLDLSREGVMARRFHEDGIGLWEPLMALASRIATVDPSNTCLDIVADLAVTRPACDGVEALVPPTSQESVMFAALRRAGSRGGAALDLAMSENTLKYYLKRVFEKWGVRDWRLAMRIAERLPAPDASE
jgi:ATP/maltotriose-dependent transcriptional regulator MalT